MENGGSTGVYGVAGEGGTLLLHLVPGTCQQFAVTIRYQNLIKLKQVNGFFPQSHATEFEESQGKKKEVLLFRRKMLQFITGVLMVGPTRRRRVLPGLLCYNLFQQR